MRWTILIVNLLAATGFLFLSSFAVAAHRAHAFSTYRSLVLNHALIEQPTSADGAPLDVERLLHGIAAGGGYYTTLGYCAAGACVLNGFLFLLLYRRNEQPPKVA
jgi:hypothetical protein